MGAKNSCFRKKRNTAEETRVDVVHKECVGTTAGTVCIEGDLNNYFQPNYTSTEEPKDIAGIRLDMQEMLKSKYINVQMPQMPWFKGLFLPLEKYYVQLEMVEGCNEADNFLPMELKEIFRPVDGLPPYRILVEGSPGYGKSTLSMKLAYDWARDAEYMCNFDLVFLIQLRSLTSPLEEAILQVGKVGDKSGKAVRTTIDQDSEKILLILDGFDELSEEKLQWILPILQCDVYPRMTVILTSRSGYLSLGRICSNASSQNESINVFWRKQIRLTGIPISQQANFLKKCFPDCSESDLQANYRRLVNLIPDLRQDIFECPLFLLLIVLLAEDRDIKTPKTKTDLYKAIFNFVIERSLCKEGVTDYTDIFFIEEKGITFQLELLRKLGKLCLSAIRAKRFMFTEKEILCACGGDPRIFKLGFIVKNIVIHRLYSHEYYEPIHNSFLEFLAAVYLWLLYENGCKEEFILELRILNQIQGEEFGQLIMPFLSGLLKENAFAVFNALEPYAFMYSDIRPFETTLMECEPTEKLLSALKEFIPAHWAIPGFYDEWFSLSPAHIEILRYGLQIGRITTLEWEVAHAASLPINFEIPRIILVIEDLAEELSGLDSTEVSCHDLILDFRYVPSDNVHSCWNNLISNLKQQFKATNLSFHIGFNTDTLIPLLHHDVCSGYLKPSAISSLICAIEETTASEQLLIALSDLIEFGNLQSLSLTLSLCDLTPVRQALNRVVLQASQAQELHSLELVSLVGHPLEICLENFQSEKHWKNITLRNSSIFDETGIAPNFNILETDYLVLDSVPDVPLMSDVLEFFRITVLECEDTVFLGFVCHQSENFVGYKTIRELILHIDSFCSKNYFSFLTKLQLLEQLSLKIMSYEDESLLSYVTWIVTAVNTLNLKALKLYNIQRNIKFLQCILQNLFDITQWQPQNNVTINAIKNVKRENCSPVLGELTIGYDKSMGKLQRPTFNDAKGDVPVYLSVLKELKGPLVRGQLCRLKIVFEKNIRKKEWIEILHNIFPWNEHFMVDLEFTEYSRLYTVQYSKNKLTDILLNNANLLV